MKLARTIADLAGSEDIQSAAHLGEALQYRPKIMMGKDNFPSFTYPTFTSPHRYTAIPIAANIAAFAASALSAVSADGAYAT